MKKTYIRPSFAVFNMTGASLMTTSLYINSSEKDAGDEQGTRKKGTTDMWGNDNEQGIWK